MQRRFLFPFALLSTALLLSNFSAARASEVSHARIVRLSYTQGAVTFHAAGVSGDATDEGDLASSGWQPAIVNTPIREGMSLGTGDGRAEVEFESGALVWISSSTVLEFPELSLADGVRLSELAVRQGTASFSFKSGKHDAFVIRVGQARIRVPGSVRLRVDVFDDGASIAVLHGAVDVETASKLQRVDSHTALTFHNDSPEQFQLSSRPALDGWDRWVAGRGDSVDTGRDESGSYLDSGVRYGAADLSYYGDWFALPGYGYAWQPWGAGFGWSPFFNGYWNNFGAFGPTWVSYEPWGWLPYHYGGWVFSPYYGWMWVPGRLGAWSPATVAWLRTSQGIGWVPRAPHDAPGRTPANLAHGIVSNTPAGMTLRLPNSMLAASAMSSVRVVGAWQNDAELAQLTRQAQMASRNQKAGGPRFAMADAIASAWRPGSAERMPAGPAPRIARSALYGGRVQVYHAPSGFAPGQSPAARWGSDGWGRASGSAPGSPAGESGHAAGAAPHGGAATGGAGGSRGGGGGSGKP